MLKHETSELYTYADDVKSWITQKFWSQIVDPDVYNTTPFDYYASSCGNWPQQRASE